MNPGPLAGIRILEVGHMLAGPYATMLLADLGAEVTKIEPPGGDISRQVGDSYFASLNRSKASVCLDLTSEPGQARLGELVSGAHALLVNLKPSAIVRLGLTYDALRQWNERIVCVALTGALGLLAQIVSGRGGQVEVSLRDVMLSQLNYRASAYLNEGTEPRRLPFGAHSYYVPAQLFPTAEGYLALFVTHDGFWKSFAAEAGIAGFLTMAERTARREEVLTAVTQALAADTAIAWESRLRRLGVPAAAVRTLPEALAAAPDVIVTAGRFRLVGSPVHVAGYHPDYQPPPRLGEQGTPDPA